MRRPPPLPQPSAPPREPAVPARSGRRKDAPRGESATEDAQQTAPVIPIAVPPELVGAPLGSGARAAPGEEILQSEAAADDPVSIREVWAAARARRKALRAEVRRFTGRQRRRRRTWAAVTASLVLLVLVTLGAAYSPLFAVERVTVVGVAQLDAAAVEEALSGQLGRPLPLVDESQVKAALVGFPLVESYALEARPPHELVVRIVERTPIGYIESRAGFTLVDAAGVALSTSPAAGSGAPVLSVQGGVGTAAFEAVGHVMRSLPEAIRVQVTAVSATTADDVRLNLGGTSTAVVWGSAERSADKAAALAAIMVSHPPAGISEYDVSSPSAVVVR